MVEIAKDLRVIVGNMLSLQIVEKDSQWSSQIYFLMQTLLDNIVQEAIPKN